MPFANTSRGLLTLSIGDNHFSTPIYSKCAGLLQGPAIILRIGIAKVVKLQEAFSLDVADYLFWVRYVGQYEQYILFILK